MAAKNEARRATGRVAVASNTSNGKFFRSTAWLVLLAIVLTGLMASAPARATTVDVTVASDGTYRDFLPSSGTSHYPLVAGPCTATNYTYSTTIGNADTFRLNLYQVPLGATITGLEITPCAASHTGAPAVVQVLYLLNGAAVTGGRYELPAGSPATLATTTFSGLSVVRTPSAILEAGIRLTGGTGGARLGKISVRVVFTPPPPFPPPGNLSATSTSSTSMNVSWTDTTTGETGFRLERSMNGTEAWNNAAVVSANGTSFVDKNLNADQTYYYRIQAMNLATGQSSGLSNIARAITYASIPATPRNLWYSQTASGITLNWLRLSNNDDGAAIERSSDGINFAEVGRASSGSSTYLHAGASAVGPFYYRVRSFNPLGYSAYSNVASNSLAPSQGPDLRVSLAATSIPVPGSQTTSFTVTYANVGALPSGRVQLVATVPQNSTFVSAASATGWQCHNQGGDAFLLQAEIGAALRSLKFHFPNLRQVFVSSHHYNGYTTTSGVVEPYDFEGGYGVKGAIEAQIRQVRTGEVDPLAGNVDYRYGAAPWVAWGPYVWAKGLTANGQGLFYELGDFNTDLVHPSTQGSYKIGGALLNYLLSSPYTGWIRNQSVPATPILPVAQPLPSPTALIDFLPGQRYFGLEGGLYPGASNDLPADHLAAGIAAGAQIQPLDTNGLPSPTGKIVFVGIGYSNTLIALNGFKTLAAADSRIKRLSRGGGDVEANLAIVNGATGGGAATTWANADHEVYNGQFGVRNLVRGWGYTEKQVQAVWYQASNSGLQSPGIKPGISGTAAGTVCKLPLGDLQPGASGTSVYSVKTTFSAARPLSLSVVAIDDGLSGTDMAPADNSAVLSLTVVP